jgi:hypothetical protein
VYIYHGKQNKYHSVGTVPKSNRKTRERSKVDTVNTQMHDRVLSWLGTGISITSVGDKLALCIIKFKLPNGVRGLDV